MADEWKRRSDDELLAAIRRTQEEMRIPEGIDTAEIAARAVSNYWNTRDVVTDLQIRLFETAHSDERRRERRAIRKKVRSEEDFKNHLAECEKCSELLTLTIEQIKALIPNRQT